MAKAWTRAGDVRMIDVYLCRTQCDDAVRYIWCCHTPVSEWWVSCEGLWESLLWRDTEMIRRLAGTQINEMMISAEFGKCSTEVYCHPLVVRLLCTKYSGVYLWLLEWRTLWCSGSEGMGAIICNWCTIILLIKRLDSCDKNQWWSNECWKWIIKILRMSSLHYYLQYKWCCVWFWVVSVI